ncbi:polysaccharide deacetylase family protein [Paenibacillus mesophilus]|uniref:polysaccharide deacetylase family protein n=1 Tax=Paenibacillus mesophilus TaxID=2582849 RepID=UPI00110DF9E7|nr:polysaccharide deacetylase family protein [Paenibacillus mesophilus]TMV49505.1 polysaccharide deacetylase family protein [Paenibacillus mesophilus]
MGRKKLLRLAVVTAVMLLGFGIYSSEKAMLTDERQLTVNAQDMSAAAEVPAMMAEKSPTPAKETAPDKKAPAGETAVLKPEPEGNADAVKSASQKTSNGQGAAPHKQGVKRVALTFDDGPDKKYTPLILDELKKREVKATFFVVGIQVAKYGDVLKRITAEGHAIGNHSWDHADLTKRTPEQVAEQIGKTDNAIHKALGTGTDLFRPPYGAADDKVKKAAAAAHRHLVQWTVDTRDWAGTTPEEMLEKVKKQTKPDGIILMHCFGGKNGKLDNTVEALPKMIDYLKEEGYTFVTVPELLAEQV